MARAQWTKDTYEAPEHTDYVREVFHAAKRLRLRRVLFMLGWIAILATIAVMVVYKG